MALQLSRQLTIEDDDLPGVRFVFRAPSLAEGITILSALDSPTQTPAAIVSLQSDAIAWLSERYIGGEGAIEVDGEPYAWPAKGDYDGLGDLLGVLIPPTSLFRIVTAVATGQVPPERLGKSGAGRASSTPPAMSATSAATL